MKKHKIRMEIIDKETGDKRMIEREIDIEGINTFSEIEKEVIKIGEEGTSFLLDESLKKNKKWWFIRLWKKILSWLKMGKKLYKSKEKQE